MRRKIGLASALEGDADLIKRYRNHAGLRRISP